RPVHEVEVGAVGRGLQDAGGRHVREAARGAHPLTIELEDGILPPRPRPHHGLPARAPEQLREGGGDFRAGVIEESVDGVEDEVDEYLTWPVLEDGADLLQAEAGPAGRV